MIYRSHDPKKTNVALIQFNRYLIIGLTVVLFLCVLISVVRLIRNKEHSKVLVLGISLALLGVFLYLSPQAIKMTGEFVYFGEDGFSTQALLRVIGFIIAHIFVGLVSLGVYKVLSYLSGKKQNAMIMLLLIVVFLDYAIRSVSAMQRLKIVPLNDFVFQLMIFGDNKAQTFIYLASLLLLGSLAYVFFTNKKVHGKFENRALLRKERARLRTKRRWSVELLVFLVVCIFSLTVIHYYDTKEVELTPPQEYTMENNKIIIPLSDVEDGHLHRFSYVTPNGYDVRFLVVKKTQGNAYGVGLDACDICGIAGYFERGDEVVCKRCDVVMNKATIGFKGGCNPVPFNYEILEGKIVIDPKVLEAEELRFK